MRVRGLLAVFAVLVLCGTPLASARALVLPTGIVNVEATTTSGAPYSWVDPATCTPASGSVFVFGDTLVDCGADGSFTVRVADTIAPVVTPPPNVTVTTGNPGGTAVTYGAASATDAVAGSPAVTCSPPSGSNFSVGTTTVTCSASDGTNTGTATFTVTVNLVDATPPTLTVPANITAEAAGPGGASVTFSVTASDAVDPNPTVSCDHSSGATYLIGTTTVTCTAKDASNNTSAPSSFNINVHDTTPPVVSFPGNLVVEANGPGGSAANFPTPTATDGIDGLRPVTCSPGSGSTFPLGENIVTCTATDTAGNRGQALFKVTVRDTTPPTLLVPAPRSVYATSALGVTDSDPAVIAFVQAAKATDIVDPQPVVGSDLHSVLPIGGTVIRFFARDFSGNNVTRDVLLTVLPLPPVNAPPLPPPAVASLPPNVANLSLASLDGALGLTWQLPPVCDHVVVSRSNSDGSDEKVVYSGKGTSFTDQGLENGVEYRYVVRCVDAAGNRSGGVAIVAVPRRNMLRSPKDGAQLKEPPTLAWAREGTADYYNLQLFRNGVRIFAAWPTKTTFVLKKAWRYQSRKYTLGPGRYQWYVWPGFGPRNEANYGALLGVRSFLIRR